MIETQLVLSFFAPGLPCPSFLKLDVCPTLDEMERRRSCGDWTSAG